MADKDAAAVIGEIRAVLEGYDADASANQGGSDPGRRALGGSMFFLSAVLVYLLVVFWRAVPQPDRTVIVLEAGEPLEAGTLTIVEADPREVFLFGGHWTPDSEVLLLLLVILAGALGSLAYSMWGFARHHGEGDYNPQWTWWYVFKPPLGALFAVGVYFLLRGGLVGVDADAGEINAYGIVGLAFIVGFATRRIAYWLTGIADRIFATDDAEPEFSPEPEPEPEPAPAPEPAPPPAAG